MRKLPNNNLFQRALTALIALPIVLSLIIYSSSIVFLFISLLILFLCTYEWAKLCNLSLFNKYIFSISALLFVLFSAIYISQEPIQQTIENAYSLNEYCFLTKALPFITAFWLCMGLIIIYYNYTLKFKSSSIQNTVNCYLGGLLIIAPSFITLNYLKTINTTSYLLIIFLLVLVWTIDTGSYFCGKLFGKHKLIKNVSPGKTVEGALGGLICLYILTIILYYNFSIINNKTDLLSWLIISSIVYLYAVVGDLSVSMMKRIVALKDTGNILPGHGGILDRLDSLFAAMPVYCYCLYIFKII